MGKTIFNPKAFKISGKVTDTLKRLDGGKSFTVLLKHYESGEPIFTTVEVEVNWNGEVSGVAYDE